VTAIPSGEVAAKFTVPKKALTAVTLMTEMCNEFGVIVNRLGIADKWKLEVPLDVAWAVIGTVTDSTSNDVRISAEIDIRTLTFNHLDSGTILKPLRGKNLPPNLHSVAMDCIVWKPRSKVCYLWPNSQMACDDLDAYEARTAIGEAFSPAPCSLLIGSRELSAVLTC
jgi:hypothetical protein